MLEKSRKTSHRIYLDHASTTPVDDRVFSKMKPYFSESFGNPSALYAEGLAAKKAVADARSTIAKLLNTRSEEIIFTGTGTEADNLAILGVYQAAAKTPEFYKAGKTPHIVTTVIEHPAILETCKAIEFWGGQVTYVPVGENGIVDPKKIAAALRPETVLVSVMYANNEIGTIQPIKEIAKAVRTYRKDRPAAANASPFANPEIGYPFFHTDASQAAGYLPCTVNTLGVDLLTLDASKIYGPKGIGALYVKKGIAIESQIHGGSQEDGKRAGTENVPLIVGLAEAFAIAQSEREKESERLTELRNYFTAELLKIFPRGNINGDAAERMPNNINICVPGLNAEFAVIQLDERGIACASVSSCKNLNENSSSYVIEALGEAEKGCGESSLRFSLGRSTIKKEIERSLAVLRELFVK